MTFIAVLVVFWVGAFIGSLITLTAMYLGGRRKWPAMTARHQADQRLEFDRGKREGLACAMHAMGFVEMPSPSESDKLVFAKIAAVLEGDEDDEWETKH
jgi:hypothetical protein